MALNNKGKAFAGVVGFAVVIGLPFGVIWSVNTLAGTQVPFTIETWLAGMILLCTAAAFNGRGSK